MILILCVSSFAEEEPRETFEAQEIRQEKSGDQLIDIKDKTKKEIQLSEKVIFDAKQASKQSESVLEKSLSDYLLKIRNYYTQLLEIKLVRIKEVEDLLLELKTQSNRMKNLETKFQGNRSIISTEDLEQASEVWRKIVDDTLFNLFDVEGIELPEKPDVPDSVKLADNKYPDLQKKINDTNLIIEKERESLKAVIFDLKQSEKNFRADLLLRGGSVRSQLMNHLISTGEFSAWAFTKNKLRDYLREVQIVPFRFLAIFTQKFVEFSTLSRSGLSGWYEIAKQLFAFALLFLTPIFIFRLFRSFSERLESFRKNIFTQSNLDYRSRTRLALWIRRINPYLPWTFAFITIYLIESLLGGTFLEPLAFLLPYIEIYIGYRVFRLLLRSVMTQILVSPNLDSLKSKQSQIEESARYLSILFFTQWALLHATQDAVRQALVYNVVFDFVVVINAIIVIREIAKWKSELLQLSKTWLSPTWFQILEKYSNHFLFAFVLPVLFVLNLFHILLTGIIEWSSQFDIGKKILSELFRKRLEDAVEQNEATKKVLPLDYISQFKEGEVDNSIRISLQKSPLANCLNIIESWDKGESSDDLILLYGNYGIGKTTLINSLEGRLQEKYKCYRMSVANRIAKKADLFTFLSNHLGFEIKSEKDLEEFDRSVGKSIIFIDDVHLLFLNTVDGLSAYKSLIELTNLQTENIFWCLSSNERALIHLNGVFGPNHFLGQKIELLSWTDYEIQDMILKRHAKSDFKLKFDRLISAVHRGDILESSAGLEVQFFRLLWGQSRGNPLSAQELWLTAVSQVREGELKVTVPDFTNAKDLSEFNDQNLLLFASIVKHENLSLREMVKVTSLQKADIKRTIKMGEDGLILQRIAGPRWRIHPKSQYVVASQLKGRNLIYG